MAKLKTYSAFVNEALIDAIKNPIKWKKIKNNAKKFQKAKVAAALNDIDYEKKKAASGSKDPDKNAILKAANSKKNDTLKQDTSDIGSRMDDLATTPGLKKVVTLAKSKSSLAANKIIIKAAVKAIYGVMPEKVNIIVGKQKRVIVRGRRGVKSGYKKAMVFLNKKDSIEFS